MKWHDYWKSLQKRTKLSDFEQRLAIRLRAYQDFKFFVSLFFSHHCRFPFSPMHEDFMRSERDVQRKGKREVIAAPRGHAKTTFKMLFKALHAIVYGYEPFILVIGHSTSEAEEKVRSILDELENNERLMQVFGPLAPRRGHYKGMGRWGKKKFVTENGVMIMAKSQGQQVRGLKHGTNRPTLIICDDVESPEAVLSPEQRSKQRDWFYKDVLKCGQIDGSTNVIVIGTRLHPESLLSELLVSPGWEARKYQAVLSFAKHLSLWEQWKQIYTNLSDPARQFNAQGFVEANREKMLEGTQVLWPEGEPYESLMKQLIDEGQASFNSEKQNEPYDPERQVLNMALAKKVQLIWHNEQLQEIHWLDGSKKRVSRSQLKRMIAFHDPALGKKPGQHSEPDYAAIVVVAEDHEGYRYCLDAYIEKDSPSQQIEKALSLHDQWRLDTLYLEENHFQSLLKQSYADAQDGRPGKKLWVQGVHQHENKYKRISTLEPEITNGYLLFAENLSPRLFDQLNLFPTTYDDGPDALEGAVSQLKKADLISLYQAAF